MNFHEKIEELKSIIHQQLAPLIDNDYVLYEVPYYNNIGDLLIWEGELHFLKSLPYSMLASHSRFTYKTCNKITSDTIILLQGGGNFGDIWRPCQDFRLKIIEQYPDNKIIIFPQTVYYNNPELMKADAEMMGRHKNLTICARDKVSYELLKKHFTNNVLLVPDMAFCINPAQLTRYMKQARDISLIVKRQDKEQSDFDFLSLHPSYKDIVTRDWPSMEKRTFTTEIGVKMTGFHRHFGAFLNFITDAYFNHYYKNQLIKTGVEFISSYKEVYTTRLHVAILCTLLEKPFYFINNSYGKNLTFYETWLQDVDNIFFIKESYHE